MSRAATQLLRDADTTWKPVGVWLATPQALQSRFLPGVGLDDFARRVHEGARRFTLMDALSNGHDLHVVEVDAEGNGSGLAGTHIRGPLRPVPWEVRGNIERRAPP